MIKKQQKTSNTDSQTGMEYVKIPLACDITIYEATTRSVTNISKIYAK
ncbi:MAG: hypothetical protein MI922_28215 [Bacteroidales bacterium]|nr:hypothetical protein [Bacteroidales bacterium]